MQINVSIRNSKDTLELIAVRGIWGLKENYISCRKNSFRTNCNKL
jgi:hypothetical protein